MRILMLSQFYPPVIGGEERHVKVLSEALAARGHDVSVATIKLGDLPGFEIQNGVRIHRLQGTLQRGGRLFTEDQRRHAPPFPDLELTWAIDRIMRQERPEVVHAHNWLAHSFTPLQPLHSAKLVVTLHDYGLVCATKNLMRDGAPCQGPSLTKCVPCASKHYGPGKGVVTAVTSRVSNAVERKLVDRFITVSESVAQRCGVSNGRVPYDVIPVFLSDTVQALGAGVDQYLEQLPAEPFLLFVGDVMRLKGVHTLLAAHAMLENAPPLVMIGRRCQDTPALLPANVSLLESWPNPAVLHAWSRCLFGIVPSTGLETCGTVAMEASAFAKPVIASRTGGLPETVRDGETGLLVPPNDVPALRDAMARLLGDSTLYRRLSDAALTHAEKFKASAVVARIESVYGAALRSDALPGRRPAQANAGASPC